MQKSPPAIIAFPDGAVFSGAAAGYPGTAVGEAVFNTAVCGYQEIASDPSYRRQIVNFTAPHIGNTGATPKDNESEQFFAAGIAARKITAEPSNWRAKQPFGEYLNARKIPAIHGIDTRAITRKLRDNGATAACIMPDDGEKSRKEAVAAAAAFAGLQGAMLAEEVSGKLPPSWNLGMWRAENDNFPQLNNAKRHVAVLDCGAKTAILRQLAARGCRVSVFPYGANAQTVLAQKPDGVLFSNGPGDPEPCEKAAALARELLNKKTPLLGICLGHQILAAALGAKTVKMKFGHHGANHPVREEKTGRVLITSQNHGFAVDAKTLPPHVRPTHVSLFDGSLQGFASDNPPVLAFQGHPEASPGPHDAAGLFDDFVKLMDKKE